MESATKWQEYTATEAFEEAFAQVMKQNDGDNETRSAHVE
jgi:elongation factor P--beta-lysine ligase